MISREKLIRKAEILRKEYQAECEAFNWGAVEDTSTQERLIDVMPDGEPTRILTYVPSRRSCGDTPLPLFISIHGGAFIRGSADFDDHFCRVTANEAHCMVVNIDFKLAPEYQFPYSVQECFGVFNWVVSNAKELGIDSNRIAVGGHNTGATIAAVVAQLARDSAGVKPVCMLLDSPIVTLKDDKLELTDFELTTPLTGASKGAFFNICYLNDPNNASTPMASPDCLEDLSGLPSAFILTAEKDPQTVKTLRYAERLRKAGVDVYYTCMEECKHGFMVRAGLAPQEQFAKAWGIFNGYLAQALRLEL